MPKSRPGKIKAAKEKIRSLIDRGFNINAPKASAFTQELLQRRKQHRLASMGKSNVAKLSGSFDNSSQGETKSKVKIK